MERQYYKQAEDLVETVSELQNQVLVKHTAAVLEEMHAQIKRRDDEIERLRSVLQDIAEMTDADNPESYRADDREGCLDTVFGVATESLTPNRY